MDQLKSNDTKPKEACQTTPPQITPPRRSFTTEFYVGLFTLASVACGGYLSIGLGDIKIFDTDKYFINAEFDNISGLKTGASVEIAGVPIGQVASIELKDPTATVRLKLDKTMRIRDDDIASIRTKGIIGDRYVKISRGASDVYIAEEGRMTETESVVDLEDVIGKFVHNLSSDKEDSDSDKGEE